MKNLFTKFLLICTITFTIGFLSFTKAQAAFAIEIVEGCSPEFWKDNTDKWLPTGFLPGQSVRSVFSKVFVRDLAQDSLLQAVMSQTGFGNESDRGLRHEEVVGTLIRVGVAALLNAAHPDVDFPPTTSQVIEEMNTALASRNRETILDLAKELKELDDGFFPCPL